MSSLVMTLAEALDAAYVSGRPAPYTVPYRMDGDLFLFKKVKTHREAIETIRKASQESVSRHDVQIATEGVAL